MKDADQTASARILVVDDDFETRDMLSAFLEIQGYRVLSVENGLEALQAAAAFRPHLIVLDLMMPVMDGETFRQRQLADASVATIPVVCLSAKDNAVQVAARTGMPCIQKPVNLSHFTEVVAALVG